MPADDTVGNTRIGPLGVDVRTRAQQNPEACPKRLLEETVPVTARVRPTHEIEFARGHLVKLPADVSAEHVQAELTYAAQHARPDTRIQPPVVDFTRQQRPAGLADPDAALRDADRGHARSA